MCSIAPCIYGRDQIWPIDLRKDSSVAHQWTQCETEHWAFSFHTATSNRRWIMSHVSQRVCSSSRVSWKWKSTFYVKFCPLSHSENRRQESPRGGLAWGIWPNFHVRVSLVRFYRCYMTHKLPSDAQKKKHFTTLLFNILAPLKGLGVCGEEQALSAWSSPIHNE